MTDYDQKNRFLQDSELPPQAMPEEIAWKELRPYLLDPREDYPEPYYMLEFNGVPFSPLGGIQAISGQKKNGKSFVVTQLMAAILGQGSDRVAQYLPGLCVPERTLDHLGHLPRVLYVDTEMEKLNSAKVLRRVHWLCGWDMKEPNDRLNVMWLRTIEDTANERAFQRRFRLIRQGIELLKPDIVFIDGIRDIIGDFNNNEESAQLVQQLMAIAGRRGICIWNALHMNPRPGNDDESKMRGHLGTELGNKATDTLVSVKNKSSTRVTFTVKQQDARSKDMEDWKFEVTDDAGFLGIPRFISNTTNDSPDTCDDLDQIASWIREAENRYHWPMTRAEVKKRVFGEIGGQKNSQKQQSDLTAALNNHFLEESSLKKNGYYMLQIGDELPF